MTFIVPEGARQVVQEDSGQLLYPSVNPKSYNNNWPGKTCPWYSSGMNALGSNHIEQYLYK